MPPSRLAVGIRPVSCQQSLAHRKPSECWLSGFSPGEKEALAALSLLRGSEWAQPGDGCRTEGKWERGLQIRNARRTTGVQQAGREVGDGGNTLRARDQGEVGIAPREEPRLLEGLLRARIRRCCPFQDFGSSLGPVPWPRPLAEHALLQLLLLA